MQPERIATLKGEYTDKYVVVDDGRPELARFKGMVGQVKTVNFNGRALVQFDGNDNRGWYDIELDYLKVVDKPEPKPPATKGKAAAGAPSPPADKPAKPEAQEKLSPLELARLEKQTQQTGGKPPASDAPAEPATEPRD
ncbi:MAG: hypothetical protein A2V98_01890 [Planctomycetes bacterium RBG_16_64_12]|nr:MAG: hypothetical protein A2V98_01890 [Planctomycetes bacterium RBG_16_64_12]